MPTQLPPFGIPIPGLPVQRLPQPVVVPPSSTPAQTTGTDDQSKPLLPNPAATFRFRVDAGGSIVGLFTECSGMQMKREVVQYKEGGVNNFVHMLPGRISYTNVKLLHGLGTRELFDWFVQGIYNGKVETRNVTITLFGWRDGSEALVTLHRWELESAYPVSWSAPALKTGDRQVAIQTIELAHRGLTMPEVTE